MQQYFYVGIVFPKLKQNDIPSFIMFAEMINPPITSFFLRLHCDVGRVSSANKIYFTRNKDK